tara:strand:- start:274 stop:699 length:426 start_codon:yes stop_codon:yes gene_type:complete
MEFNSNNSKTSSKIMSEDLKNIMMYYHTSLRNVGLFSTLSISLFTFSLFFHKKNNLIATTILHFISLLSLIISIFIAYYLSHDLEYFIIRNKEFHKTNSSIVNKWHSLSQYVLYFIFVLILIFLYVLFNDIKQLRSKFKLF